MMANKNERPIPGCKVMSKDSFWTLVEEVKNACGQDQEKYMDMLKARLKEQGAEYAQDFHNIVHAYKDLAYKYGLWSACGLMGHATDDGFIDFRAWLISQGKEAYFAALKDPDSLADLDSGDGFWFESFSYAGYYVIEELTGENAYDNMNQGDIDRMTEDLKADIEYGAGINYPYELPEMLKKFPRLFQKNVVEASQKTLEPMCFRIRTWNYNDPAIVEARQAELSPKPQNTMEMGGM